MVFLDVVNWVVVVWLVEEKKVNGVVMVGILYDEDVCMEIVDWIIDVIGFVVEVVV